MQVVANEEFEALFPQVPPETQPKLQPRALRLSAMISQYFIRVQVDHELPPVAPKMQWACHGRVRKKQIGLMSFSKVFTGARAQAESATLSQ
jgi:hypothetical protein